MTTADAAAAASDHAAAFADSAVTAALAAAIVTSAHPSWLLSSQTPPSLSSFSKDTTFFRSNYCTPVSEYHIFLVSATTTSFFPSSLIFSSADSGNGYTASHFYGGSGWGGCGGVCHSAVSASSGNIPDSGAFAQLFPHPLPSKDHAKKNEAIIQNCSSYCSWTSCHQCHFNWPTISCRIPSRNS